jgi:hypothetical protein
MPDNTTFIERIKADAEKERQELDRQAKAKRGAEARRDANVERIADALERLVIAADSIATLLSLQALPKDPAPTTHAPHTFKSNPDLAWLCGKCGQEEQDNCHWRSIATLGLSVRSCNCLEKAGIASVQELTDKTEAEILQIPGIWRRTFPEIQHALKREGLTLKGAK